MDFFNSSSGLRMALLNNPATVQLMDPFTAHPSTIESAGTGKNLWTSLFSTTGNSVKISSTPFQQQQQTIPKFLVGGFVGSKICHLSDSTSGRSYSNLLGHIINSMLIPQMNDSSAMGKMPVKIHEAPKDSSTKESPKKLLEEPAIIHRTVSESSEVSWASDDLVSGQDQVKGHSNPWLSGILGDPDDDGDSSASEASDWDYLEEKDRTGGDGGGGRRSADVWGSEPGEWLRWDGDCLSPIPVVALAASEAQEARDDEEEDEEDGVVIQCGGPRDWQDQERERIEFLEAVNRRWDEQVELKEDGDQTDSCPNKRRKSNKQVSWARDKKLARVRPMVVWATAARLARSGDGHWERVGRDALRFRHQRIQALAPILEPVLDPAHRQRVYNTRILPQDPHSSSQS